MSPPIDTRDTREPDTRPFWKEIAVLVISCAVGGGTGTAITYQLIQYRVEQLESRVEKIDAAVSANKTLADDGLKDLQSKLSDVRSDVSWIRGKLEGK